MDFSNECGVATPVIGTTSGFGTIGAGKPLNLLGWYVAGALTAQILQLWSQTANGTLGLVMMGTGTCAANAFYRYPAQFPRGLCYWLTNENTSITFFWVPMSST